MALANSSLIIHHTGPTMFAAITVASAPMQMLPFSDLGLGAGVLNAVAGSKDGDTTRIATVASAMRILCFSTVVLVLVAVLGVSAFSWTDVLNISGTGVQGLDPATAVALALFAVSVPLGLGQRVLIGVSRNALAIALSCITPVVAFLTTLTVIAIDAPPAAIIAGPAVGCLLNSGAYFAVAQRDLRLRWTHLVQRRAFRASGLINQGLSFLILSTASLVPLQVARVMLAHQAGLKEVSIFSLASQLYFPVWSFVTACGIALWPVFSRQRNEGRYSAKDIFQVATGFAVASVVAGGLMTALGPTVTGEISRGSIDVSTGMFVSVSCLLVSQTIQFVLGVSLTSPRDLWFQAFYASTGAAAALIVIWMTASSGGAKTPFLVLAATVLTFQSLPCMIRISRISRLLRPRLQIDSIPESSSL